MFRSAFDVMSRMPVSEKEDEIQEIYKCDSCDSGWCSESEFELHKKDIHRDKLYALLSDPKQIVCEVCFKEFESRKQRIEHVKTIHLHSSEHARRVERDLFICNHCHEIFFNKYFLKLHIMFWHLKRFRNGLKVECPLCKKPFKLSAVWFHFTRHNLMSVSCCPVCFTKCQNRNDLMNHMKCHRPNFTCEMCSIELRSQGSFEDHIQREHTKSVTKYDEDSWPKFAKYFVPRHRFPLFVKKTKSLTGLRLPRSLRICVLCREICYNKEQMINHIKNDHVCEKTNTKFKCECGEEFEIKVLLKHHVFKLKGKHKMVEAEDAGASVDLRPVTPKNELSTMTAC